MSAGPHPFPPVVRWAVLPALAGLIAGSGGILVELLATGYFNVSMLRMAGFGIGLGAGSAVGAMLGRRLWVVLLAGPPIGLLILCAVLAGASLLEDGRPASPIHLGLQILQLPATLLGLGVALIMPMLAWHFALRKTPPPTCASLVLMFAVIGMIAGLVELAVWDIPDRDEAAATIALVTAIQVIPLLLARHLAARLRPPVAP